jgi:hypothetical protein
MAKTNPSLVGTEIGHWNASQVSADGWTHQHHRVAGLGKGRLRGLVQSGGIWQSLGLFHFTESESSHENQFSVPSSLEHFSGGELRDVQLLVWVSHVSDSGNHLLVDASHEGLNSEDIAADDESLKHVDLSSLDFIVFILFIPESKILKLILFSDWILPVLVKPVVDLGLGVNGVSEVGGSGGCYPELGLFIAKHVIDQLLVLPVIVLLENSEVSHLLA